MILVTGGAGFIGSNLVAALTARGEEVVVLDWLGDGEKWRNLDNAILAGLLPPTEVDAALALKPRAVMHLGAISATTVTDGDLVAASNLTLSLKLWDWCAAHGVPYIYASSAATYGNGDQGFADEETPEGLALLKPLNLYGWSKLVFDRRVAQMLVRGYPAPPQWAGLRFYYSYPGEPHTPQAIDCFGGPSLRLYPRGDDDDSRRTLKQDITSIVQKYEEKSKTVCEKCGREGSVRKNLPHICTLCDACYENCSKTRG